jgi:hypothetical protein
MPARKYQVWDIIPWLSGLPAPDRYERLIMALQAYFDDSGRDDPPVFVLAGYVARAEQWAAFSDEWSAALAADPAIDYFKMQEAFSASGQFEGWSRHAIDGKLLLLANIIPRYVLQGLGVTVLHNEYNEVMRGQFAPQLDRPYLFLYNSAVTSTLSWVRQKYPNEKVDFIFDEQQAEGDFASGLIRQVIAAVPDEAKKNIGRSPVPGNDRDDLPLQAADMLAWHLRRSFYLTAVGRILESAAVDVIRTVNVRLTHLDRGAIVAYHRQFAEHMASLNDGRGPLLMPHQMDRFVENLDYFVTGQNNRLLSEAKAGEVINLLSIRATEVRRYLLVHRCPNEGSPHLHRRSGGECLAGR